MATVRPRRNRIRCHLSDSVWWEPAGVALYGDATSDLLRFADDAGGTKTFRTFLKFDCAGLPDWTGDPQTTLIYLLLHIYLTYSSGETGLSSIKIETGRINSAWTSADSITTLNTVWGGVSWNSPVDLDALGWYADGFVDHANYLTYGVAIALDIDHGVYTPGGEARIDRLVAAPVLDLHYQIDMPAGSYNDIRSDPRPIAQAELDTPEGTGAIFDSLFVGRTLDVAGGEELDLSDEVSVERGMSVVSTKVKVPELWDLQNDAAGGLRIARDDGSRTAEALVGRSIDASLRLTRGMYTATLGGRLALARGVKTLRDSHDFEILSQLDRARRLPVARDADEWVSGVSWTAESNEYVLWDLLLNCGRFKWEDIYPADWNALVDRFQGVFSLRDLAFADVSGALGSALSEVARVHGLAISPVAGRIAVWHPAIYRPSFRVHSFDLDEGADPGYSIRPAARKLYTKLETTYEWGASSKEMTIHPRIPKPDFSLELLDYEPSVPADSLDAFMWFASLRAWLNQLSQPLAYGYEEIEFVTDKRAYAWAVGDRLLTSSAREGYDDTPFTISGIQATMIENKVKVNAVYWPRWYGSHSLFEGGRLEGIYRLWDWSTDAFDGSNTLWNGTLGSFTNTGDPVINRAISWQGAVLIDTDVGTEGKITAPGSATFKPAAGLCDVIEMQVMTYKSPDRVDVDARDNYWLWYWKRSGAADALVFGISRLPTAAGATATESCFFLGYTTSWPYVDPPWSSWSRFQLLPQGVGRGLSTFERLVQSVAVQWGVDGSDVNFRIYVDGYLIAAPRFATISKWGDCSIFEARTMNDGRVGIGTIRKFQFDEADGALTVAELCGINGTDPEYK